MSIKNVVPISLKTTAKEFLGIGRIDRAQELCRSAQQSTNAQIKLLEERVAPFAGIDNLEHRIKQLADRLALLESVAGFAKNIDLIRFDDFFYFVYEDDIPHYSNPPDTWRQHTKLCPTEISSLVASARASDARRDLHRTDAVARAIWSMAKTGQPVNLIYVGCSYGFHVMKVADFVLKQKLNCRIVAFDPGLAGTLTAPTLRLNQLHNVEFFNLAVSSTDSHAIMQQIVGHSEDNKLVNIVDSPLRISRLVETVTLDAFCAQHGIAGPTVLVIDTQGNEPQVIAGAARYLKNNVSVIVSEFTPWALGARMLAQDYVALLSNYGDVYNLGVVEHRAANVHDAAALPSLLQERVTAENRDAFSGRVLREPPHWTDVLVIPEDHALGRQVADDFSVATFNSVGENIPSAKAA